MTSQDIKKQLKEPHFWNIVLTGQHAEPRTKAMLEAKGIITASTCSGPASMGKDIKRNTHPGYPEMCIRLYIQ